ncbi:Choline-sulfatase [Alloactinosynnema sp. L-07]|nr:Choline-sulfatase [Alloactinosynnema sp. L-07]
MVRDLDPYASHEPNVSEAKYADTVVPAWDGRPSVPEADRSDKPQYVRNGTSTLADGKAQRRRQLRSLLSVDDAVQAFKDKLAALGQLQDTLVIYVPDNGYHWAGHGLLGKATPYSPAHEVPFYLSWPAAGLGAGTVDNRIVANIDVAPTVLDAAGITPAGSPDGQSLLSSAGRGHLLTEWWKQGSGASVKDTWASYVSKTEQYVEYYDVHTDAGGNEVGTGQVRFREYYDLVNDPFQLVNKLHGATPAQEQAWGVPALAAQLAADRASWWAQVWARGAAPTPWGGSRDVLLYAGTGRGPGGAVVVARSVPSKRMVGLAGGAFLMGTDDGVGYPGDGEGPVRDVTLSPFAIWTGRTAPPLPGARRGGGRRRGRSGGGRRGRGRWSRRGRVIRWCMCRGRTRWRIAGGRGCRRRRSGSSRRVVGWCRFRVAG